MRKFLVLVLSVFMITSLYGTASAWTLRVRHDPQETQARGDIRKVSSDLTARRMFLEVSTWRRTGSRYLFLFSLDTSGSKAYDRFIDLVGGSRQPTCIVQGRAGFIIGAAQVTRPNRRSVGCVIPRSWFPRIHRAVRFYVVSTPDRAPNYGNYRWV